MNAKIEELLKSLAPNPEDIILIRSLFSHPGWSKYEEKLKNDLEYLSGEIDKITDGRAISSDLVEHLKQLTAIRYAIRIVLLHKEELLDEIENPLTPEVPEDPSKFTGPLGAE